MSNIFKPKRSNTASSVPTTGQLADGELAVNTVDKKIFVRDGASVVEVANFSTGGSGTNYWVQTAAGIHTLSNVGIGTTNPQATLQVGTGVSVYGTTGIVSAVSFYGSGVNLTGIVTQIVAGTNVTISPVGGTGAVTINSTASGGGGGIQINDSGNIVGTGITILNFNGSGISTVTASAGIATVTIPSPLSVTLYGGNAVAWTNQPAAVTFFLGATGNSIVKLDLSTYTQGRLLVNKTTVAGATNASLLIRYSTTFTQTAASYLTMGTTEIESIFSTNASGYFDSGWIDLVAGAQADGIFVGLLGRNGNGNADPQFGTVFVQFR